MRAILHFSPGLPGSLGSVDFRTGGMKPFIHPLKEKKKTIYFMTYKLFDLDKSLNLSEFISYFYKMEKIVVAS